MYNLLIAEDEVIERQALKKILEKGLAEVHVCGEAANGREAVDMADQYKPDMILMDMKMPGIDGVAAIKKIKRMAPDTKFIVVSAYDTFTYAQEVMREGVKDYLLKPTKKEDVIHAVGRVIREIRAEQSGQQPTTPNGQDNDHEGYSLLKEAQAYVDDYFRDAITLEDVAAHIGLSPQYLSKLFKQTAGQTFIDYVTQLRIHEAERLLKSTHLSHKQICFEVGYHDPNYFSRVFKKITGQSPSTYRSYFHKQGES